MVSTVLFLRASADRGLEELLKIQGARPSQGTNGLPLPVPPACENARREERDLQPLTFARCQFASKGLRPKMQ